MTGDCSPVFFALSVQLCAAAVCLWDSPFDTAAASFVLQSLVKVLYQVFFGLEAAGDADQAGGDAGGRKLFIRHLAMGRGGRIQAAASGVSHMGLDRA